MSHRAVMNALDRLHHREVLLFPVDVSRFQSGLESLAALTFEQGEAQMLETRKELSMSYGSTEADAPRKPFAFANGLAVIPIHGSLLNRFSGSYGGATGYNFIRSQMRAALADDDVKGIVFDINSPGGEAAGCFELASEIMESRSVKPSLALVDTLCASAAYALGSAASKMAVVRSAVVGSIGVLTMHADVSTLLDNLGIKISLIHSGKHKVDGNPLEPLPDEVRKDIQANIDELRAEFVSTVAKQRGLEEKAVFDTEAKTYRGKKAVEMGLADSVASVQEAVSSFMSALPGATSMESSNMQTAQQAAAAPVAAAPAQAATPAVPAAAAPATPAAPVLDASAIQAAEQQRIKEIMSLEGAAANQSLANQLAFNTRMSVEDANGMLAASKPAAPAAPAATAPNPLDAAMAAHTGGKPVAPADVASGDKASASGANTEVLAQFDASWFGATGRKPKAA